MKPSAKTLCNNAIYHVADPIRQAIHRAATWGVCVFMIFLLVIAGYAQLPNILWITVEDIGSHLGCYGVSEINTPVLDAFAKEGVRYTNMYATAPVCAVNRTSILTGVYPTTIGAHHMRNRILYPSAVKTYPELMRQAGYYCTNPGKTDYQFDSPVKGDIWSDAS